MSIPGISIEEATGVPPLPDAGIISRVAIIAPANAGTFNAKPIYGMADFAEFDKGVLVRHGKHIFAETKVPVVVVRCAATNPGEYDTIDNSAVTGTAVPVVASAIVPTDEAELYVKIVDGGTIGTPGITFRRSDSNGREQDTNMPLRALGIATSVDFVDVGARIEFDPPVNSLVSIATELRADRLAHYADAVAHNAADAAAIAIITEGVPATNAAALLVINQVRLADIAHADNATAHDSFDVANRPTLAAATTLQEARLLAIHLKSKANAHNAANVAAAPAALKAATVTVAAPVTILAAALLAPGLLQLANYPAQVTFTTAGGTPSDAPTSVTIVGTDETGAVQTEAGLALSQMAGAVTSTQHWKTITSVAYLTADGTDATISIGIASSAHNSADVANDITAADPGAGTLLAGNVIRCKTIAPTPNDTDIVAAFDKLKVSPSKPGMVLFPGRTVAALATTISTGLNTLEGRGVFVPVMVQARASDGVESLAEHVDNVETEWLAEGFDKRILVVAGDQLGTFNDGTRLQQRYTGWSTHEMVRAIQTEYFRTTWQRIQLDKVTHLNSSGVPIGWDESNTPDKPRRVQVGYEVPGTSKFAPSFDSTLYDPDNDRTQTFREERVIGELKRIVNTWGSSQIGSLGEVTPIANTQTATLSNSSRLSLQQSLAAIIAANMGGTPPNAALVRTDRPDLVVIDPIVDILGAIFGLRLTVNFAIIAGLGRISATLAVRTGS